MLNLKERQIMEIMEEIIINHHLLQCMKAIIKQQQIALINLHIKQVEWEIIIMILLLLTFYKNLDHKAEKILTKLENLCEEL
jgi:hypothetical protein